jgi:hypothetical protein
MVCFYIFLFFFEYVFLTLDYFTNRHSYLGTWHRVPRDWEFPRCGVRDLWRQWWIGDGRRQIPPLRYLDLEDVKHIDKKPVSEQERHGRRGKFKAQRRKAVKIMSDINYLIKFIRKKLEAKGKWIKRHDPITQRRINEMFAEVNDEFMINNRDVQKSWITVVRQLRAIYKKSGTNNDDSDNNDESDYEYDTDDDLL